MKKYIPKLLRYPLAAIYILYRCLLRGSPNKNIVLNLAGALPPPDSKKIVHGGKVKLLHLRERFGDTWKHFNIAYFVSSGLPFAPALWIKVYKFFGIKVIWNQNGTAYPALYPQGIVKRINDLYKPINLCDFVIYQTQFCKRCSDQFATKFNGPFEILINPVDTKHFTPKEMALGEPFVIIMSGHHFESEERMRVSIEAVRNVRNSGIDTRLLVIGSAKNVPKEDWIEEAGPFTQDEAPDLYRKGHILLHLKYLDPCPTLVLEALACGIPVVGSASGGMPELVDEKSGVLIPIVEDFNKLHYPNTEDGVKAIITIRGNYGEYSKSARRRALEKFDKKDWLGKHEAIFKKLLAK